MSPKQSDRESGGFAEAQRLLKDTLEQACSVDITGADTGQLIRVEEMLAIADDAAKKVISIKRRSRHDRERSPHAAVDAEGGHRRFQDAAGVVWEARAIHPSATSRRVRLPEPYESGWLAFESPGEKRRLSPIPPDWAFRSDDGLRQLCEAAQVVPPRPLGGESPSEDQPS
ncbi:MAG: hypothetical protein ACJ8AD_14450 [Gemmatimonadaceae bacterium]